MTWDNDLSCMYYIGLVCTTVAWFNCRTLDDIYRPAGTGGGRGKSPNDLINDGWISVKIWQDFVNI